MQNMTVRDIPLIVNKTFAIKDICLWEINYGFEFLPQREFHPDTNLYRLLLILGLIRGDIRTSSYCLGRIIKPMTI